MPKLMTKIEYDFSMRKTKSFAQVANHETSVKTHAPRIQIFETSTHFEEKLKLALDQS